MSTTPRCQIAHVRRVEQRCSGAMRIAIVAAHFMPEVGYKEVFMANVLARLGHEVNVISTTNKPAKTRDLVEVNYPVGRHTAPGGYLIWRMPTCWSLGSMVFPKRSEVWDAVAECAPKLVIVIGVGKVFPRQLLVPATKRSYGLISFFGDNDEYFPKAGMKQRLINMRVWFIKQLVKNRIVRRAVAVSDLIVGYTPDTYRILHTIVGGLKAERLQQRYLQIPLGYDSAEYHYDDDARTQLRNELQVTETEILVITATRLTPPKKVELAIHAIAELSKNFPMKYVVVGSLGDAYAKELQDLVDTEDLRNVVTILPFMDTARKRAFYCAADLGVWGTAAITIQEAMGTGLKVVLPDKTSVAHLVTDGVNGWISNAVQDGLTRALEELVDKRPVERAAERRAVESWNREFLSYDIIMEHVLREYSSTCGTE